MTAVGEGAWRRLARMARPLDEAMLRRLSPIVVLSPHQDDETLGCGGLLAETCRLGLRPRVAFLTDGSASHQGSPTWPADRLARVRRREALAALAVLGVPESDVRFIGWRDASPPEKGSEAYERGLAGLVEWMRGFAARGLWAPWAGERHCDHLAAARLARDAAGRLGGEVTLMSYLVWGWAEPALTEAAAPGEIWGLSCPETAPLRRRALASHRTQTTDLIDDAVEAFRVGPELAALTDRPVEIHLGRP